MIRARVVAHRHDVIGLVHRVVRTDDRPDRGLEYVQISSTEPDVVEVDVERVGSLIDSVKLEIEVVEQVREVARILHRHGLYIIGLDLESELRW